MLLNVTPQMCVHKIFGTSIIYIWTPDTKFSDLLKQFYPTYSQKYAYMLHTRYRPRHSRQEIWQMGLYWPMRFDSVL